MASKKTSTVKTIKPVVILARIAWNHEDRVCYQVRSSVLKDSAYKMHRHGVVEINGVEYKSVVRDGERHAIYNVCVVDGQVTGCTCPAFSACYHKEGIQAIENERRAAQVVEVVAEPVVVAPIATASDDAGYIGEDGLDNRLVSSWITRNKRSDVEHVEFVKGFNVKLQASKENAQLQEAS